MSLLWVIVGCIAAAFILVPLAPTERFMAIASGGVGLLWVISIRLSEIHKTLLEIRKAQLEK